MWIAFSIILFLVSAVTSTLLYFSLRRINQYEDLIVQFQQIIDFSTDKMKQVDVEGHYKSDDETGFFFQQLKDIQLLLSNVFEPTEETQDAKKEK